VAPVFVLGRKMLQYISEIFCNSWSIIVFNLSFVTPGCRDDHIKSSKFCISC
jgi:hypothetical protein